VGCAEGVVAAFFAARETGDAPVHAQLCHGFPAPGQDLVRIRLVTHVPHQAVVGRVEHIVQRDGQLDGAKVRGQVPARLRHRLEHELSKLRRQPRERLALQFAQMLGIGDRVQ
jgi:hypothetical protein